MPGRCRGDAWRWAGPGLLAAAVCLGLVLWLWLVPGGGGPGFVLQAWVGPEPGSTAPGGRYLASYQLLNTRPRAVEVRALAVDGAEGVRLAGLLATARGRTVAVGAGGRLDRGLVVPGGGEMKVDLTLESSSPEAPGTPTLVIRYRAGLRLHVDRVRLGLPGPA